MTLPEGVVDWLPRPPPTGTLSEVPLTVELPSWPLPGETQPPVPLAIVRST